MGGLEWGVNPSKTMRLDLAWASTEHNENPGVRVGRRIADYLGWRVASYLGSYY